MSLLKIADAIGTAKEITEAEVRSVGATLYIGDHIEEGSDVWSHLMMELDPQTIKPIDNRVTKVDL